jgi:hypothetical protein
MAFESGISGNPSGRPKGSRNKAGTELRELITGFLESRFEQVVSDFDQLKPKDRIKIYADLLQYGLPKLQAASATLNYDELSEAQLEDLINHLLDHHE